MPRDRRSASTAIILFADIVDSTALTERMGDAAFRALARRLDAAMRSIIRDGSGEPIEGKLLGDGVLAVFDSAQRAIDCAMRCAAEGAAIGLPLHVGVHAGDVIREANNVFGGAVNIAARIAALSELGDVLVSDTVRSLARTSTDVVFEDHGVHDLKGIGEPLRLFLARRRRGGISLTSWAERGMGRRSRLIAWIAAFVLLGTLLAGGAIAAVLIGQNILDGDRGSTYDLARTTLRLPAETVRLDVARTDEEKQQLGMRDRRALAEGTGLLFDGVQPSTAWDTAGYRSPVDLVWVDAARTVISVAADVRRDTSADDAGGVSVPADARYVIELNSGGAGRLELRAGAQLAFYPATTITLPDGSLNAEVACSFFEQDQVGLKALPSLDQDSALLYNWRLNGASNWGTASYLFPIDIVWLDEGKNVISSVPEVAPDTTGIPQPPGMYYVIEMNAGAAARLGLEPGTALAFDVPCDT